MTEQQKQTELELALLALQSGRFEEAEKSFLKLLKEEGDNGHYWCGLAQAKYGRVISGERTYDFIDFTRDS